MREGFEVPEFNPLSGDVKRIDITPPRWLIDTIELRMHEVQVVFQAEYVKAPSKLILSRQAVAALKLVQYEAMRSTNYNVQDPTQLGSGHSALYRGIPVECDPTQEVPVRAVGTFEDSFLRGVEVRR